VSISDVTVIEMLREGEKLGRSRIDWHVSVGDGTLQSKELRGDLRDDGESCGSVFGLETEI
jgi:hypothetical protein